MTMELFLLGLILVVGLFAAWNIGANDVAIAMGTSVGSDHRLLLPSARRRRSG